MRKSSEFLLRQLYRAGSHNRPSRAMGRLADVGLPRPVLDRMIRTYVRTFGIDLAEAIRPEGGWATFDSFFTRHLVDGARPIDQAPGVLIAPCDGRVQSSGFIEGGTLLQAKGRPYALADLLCDPSAQQRFEGGRYVTLYLSPRDYHRVHFPDDGQVTGFAHVPGALYTVAPRAAGVVSGLFARNERLCTRIQGDRGETALVMVGATGVGRISVSYCDVCTNTGRDFGASSFLPPIPCRKGEELGVFHLGSTVILVLSAGSWLDLIPPVGQPVRMGQALLRAV